MSKYSGTYEFIFFHDQKKGDIIVSFNGDRHVFKDGVAEAVKAERERIIKLLEGLIDTRPDESNGGWRGYSLERIIEAIKGDQK